MFFKSYDNYKFIARLFHWGMAILLITLFIAGYWMAQYDFAGDPIKFTIYNLHKFFGVVALVLVTLRLIYRYISPPPSSNLANPLLLVSRIAHFLLYIFMFAIPISGYLLSAAYGYMPNFFGYKLPSLVEKNKELGELAGQAHFYLPRIAAVVVVLHILGALYHHFIAHDNTLKKMLGTN